MERALTLDDVRRALVARDSDLADRIVALAEQPDPQPGVADAPPVREGAPTFAAYVAEVRSHGFSRKKPEEQAHYRVEAMKALEAPGAEVPLPERARVHEIITELWRAEGAYERDTLIQVLSRAPIRWGAFRAMKRIFKEAEARGDWEILGVLSARFDAAFAAAGAAVNEITRKTLAYLVRRAWRALRRQAEQLPAAYPDAAVLVLASYAEGTRWATTWVANHIFYHESKKHTRRRFKFDRRLPQSLTQHRAYGELWRRTPRPLFTLITRARSEQARAFAVAALKADFRATLREVEPAWVARLVAVPSPSAHDLAVWLLGNVPRFEQGAFRDLGLHAPVLSLFDSPSGDARAYAAAYARAHARDLPLDDVVRLANNDNEEVRKLAKDLLHDRDPRKDVGLDGWGRLLGTPHGHELATAALRKHFSAARDLNPAWFKDRLLSDKKTVFDFAADLIGKVHTPKALGAAFYADLLDDERLTAHAARYAADGLSRFSPADIGVDALRRALVHPHTRAAVTGWIQEDKVPAKDLGVDFLKALSFEPTWDVDAWVSALKKSGRVWARDLAFSEPLSELSLKLLADVRKISPGDLGFDWLLRLAGRSEKRYADFAVEYMIKAFVPADFASVDDGGLPPPKPPSAATTSPVDLKGKSFLFTGKLATMQRAEAEGKVTGANGRNAGTVNAKLDYLVIGDDGSPLYGAGRKGSKQLAAEKLVGQGAALKIISETAFLQMLAGEERTFSADKTGAGCDTLWKMATEPGPVDAPLRVFALRYLRRHHNDISLQLTDRPVDPGAEIPAEYLSFDRVRAILADPRAEIRALGLEFARWELARWKPPIDGIVALCESPYADVRAFVAKALLAGDEKEHARYRVDPKTLTADAVYRFCESLDAGTRALGMKLIGRNPDLAVPEELFRLAESPDRLVRAFVVKTFWSAYRERGITMTWKPAPPPASTVAKKPDARKAEEAAKPRGGPPPRPEKRPAIGEALRDFLRRALFVVPPGRLPKGSIALAKVEGEGAKAAGKKPVRPRPIPARKAKLLLLETLRDLAVEDGGFARVLVPLLREFMTSRGPSERAACLVAITRIDRAHPELKGAA